MINIRAKFENQNTIVGQKKNDKFDVFSGLFKLKMSIKIFFCILILETIILSIKIYVQLFH